MLIATKHFKNNFILDSCIIENVHELFINVMAKYNRELEKSIENLKRKNILKPKMGRNFYNYLILDGDLLYKIINNFDIESLKIKSIKNEDIEKFKDAIVYVGKGKNNRKDTHLVEAKNLFIGKLPKSKITAKVTKIEKIWKQRKGIVVFQIFSDSDHYMSLCRENAMIKAVGSKLTNLINGSIYGIMEKKWTIFETRNFGEMLLYFALEKCILEKPIPIFPEDITKKKTKPIFEPKKYFIKTNYEFNGILDCFLEM